MIALSLHPPSDPFGHVHPQGFYTNKTGSFTTTNVTFVCPTLDMVTYFTSYTMSCGVQVDHLQFSVAPLLVPSSEHIVSTDGFITHTFAEVTYQGESNVAFLEVFNSTSN